MASDVLAQVSAFYGGRLLPDQLLRVLTQDHGWFPSAPILKPPKIRQFSRRSKFFPDLAIFDQGRHFDLVDYVTTNAICGLIIVKSGELALDWFRPGISASTPWFSASLAKSIAVTLILMGRSARKLPDLDTLLSDIIDAGPAYANVTLDQVLRMTSGAAWNEDYVDPASDRRRLLAAQLECREGAMLDVTREAPRANPPGTTFNYNTGESCLLGPLYRAATGRDFSREMEEVLWPRVGAAHDATWWSEGEGGPTVAGTGLYAAIGDYVRFGQFVLEAWQGDHPDLLPAELLYAATNAKIGGEARGVYGQMWWLPDPCDQIIEQAFQAEGIYGQVLHINPPEDLVIFCASARAKPGSAQRLQISDAAFCAAVARALS